MILYLLFLLFKFWLKTQIHKLSYFFLFLRWIWLNIWKFSSWHGVIIKSIARSETWRFLNLSQIYNFSMIKFYSHFSIFYLMIQIILLVRIFIFLIQHSINSSLVLFIFRIEHWIYIFWVTIKRSIKLFIISCIHLIGNIWWRIIFIKFFGLKRLII